MIGNTLFKQEIKNLNTIAIKLQEKKSNIFTQSLFGAKEMQHLRIL
jgi:hypothetical protein